VIDPQQLLKPPPAPAQGPAPQPAAEPAAGWRRITLSDGTTFDLPDDSNPAVAQVSGGLPALDDIGTMLKFAFKRVTGSGDMTDLPQVGPATERVARKTGTLIARNPGKAGALGLTLAAAPFTGGLSLLPEALAMGAAGGIGAAGGLAANKLAGGDYTKDMTGDQAAKEIVSEGALNGLTTGLMRPVMWGVQGGANALMDTTLGLNRAVRMRFSGVDPANVLNREAINPMSTRGLAKADRLRDEAVATRDAMTSGADAAGAPPFFPATQSPTGQWAMDPELRQALDKVYAQAVRQVRSGRDPEAFAKVVDQVRALNQGNPNGITMRDLSGLISDRADQGAAAYSAFKARQVPSDLEANTAKGLADGMRRVQRRRVTEATGADVGAANRRAQEMIEASQIAAEKSQEPVRLGGWGSKTTGIITGGSTYAATHDPLAAMLASAAPLLLGSSHVSAPLAIMLWHAARALPTTGRAVASATDPWTAK
jgi:hypothetical protein